MAEIPMLGGPTDEDERPSLPDVETIVEEHRETIELVATTDTKTGEYARSLLRTVNDD